MATTSFNKKSAQEIVKAPPPSETQIATQSPAAGFEGEFTSKDVSIPALMLMQKQSKNFDKRPGALGCFVYDEEIVLGQEIDVMFFAVRKYYIEDLPYGTKEIPRTAYTIDQVMAEGWTGSVEAADIDLLVGIKPEACGTNLGWYTDKAGVQWAPARYQVRKHTYKAIVGILLKDLRRLGGDVRAQVYSLQSTKKENTMGSWYAVNMKCREKTSAELIEFHESTFGKGIR